MKKFMIIAGEASGDMHAANLVKAIKEQQPKSTFFGIGGQKMQDQGVDIIFDANKIAVVGLFEVLKHFKDIRQAWQQAKTALLSKKPDLLILVDYPGFNLRFAKFAKQNNTKVLYYISPQIWAWHQSRVHKIKQCVDHMAVIFPFEVEFYKKYSVPVSFVGSPLLESTKSSGGKSKARYKLTLDPKKTVIGLLPGSRQSEITRLLPVMLDASLRLSTQINNIEFILPIASGLDKAQIKSYLKPYSELNIQLIENNANVAIEACDVIICSSGTATLEAAILKTPMVIIYKTSAATYFLATSLIKIKNIGLCNIVAGEQLVPELIQHQATDINICAKIKELLKPDINKKLKQQLQTKVTNKLGKPGAASNTAKLALSFVDSE